MHSKGPWEWRKRRRRERLVSASGYEVVCGKTEKDPLGDGFIHCSESDARLIAAAPEMYDLLERMAEAVELDDPGLARRWAALKASIDGTDEDSDKSEWQRSEARDA